MRYVKQRRAGLHLNFIEFTHRRRPIIQSGGTIMAPINTDLVGLAFSEQPAAALLSIVVLFIASIALLILCASCKKHSFELENSRAPAAQKSSTLVSVARMNDAGARHNPTANEITGDEIGFEADSGNVAVSPGGIVYKPWRSHTLTHGSSPQTQANGGVGQ